MPFASLTDYAISFIDLTTNANEGEVPHINDLDG
jgi:hypothetical protein